jgi:aquaporin related protein
LIVTAWAFFRISGAHFNPAISFSSLITGHLSIPRFVIYFVSQILGAMLGIALIRGTTPSSENIGQVNELVSFLQCLFVVNKVTSKRNEKEKEKEKERNKEG